jgi:hypothetical protein
LVNRFDRIYRTGFYWFCVGASFTFYISPRRLWGVESGNALWIILMWAHSSIRTSHPTLVHTHEERTASHWRTDPNKPFKKIGRCRHY